MSAARKERKGLSAPKTAPRGMTPAELLELQDLHRIVRIERFKAEQVAGNTAVIPRGKELAAECEAVAQIFENFKQQWISDKLREMGFKPEDKVSIDLVTGRITLS